MLLGLVRETEGKASAILSRIGFDVESLRNDIKIYYKKGSSDKENSETPVLDEFGRDLTALARDGKLDPVVGRQDEIVRLLLISFINKVSSNIFYLAFYEIFVSI